MEYIIIFIGVISAYLIGFSRGYKNGMSSRIANAFEEAMKQGGMKMAKDLKESGIAEVRIPGGTFKIGNDEHDKNKSGE